MSRRLRIRIIFLDLIIIIRSLSSTICRYISIR